MAYDFQSDVPTNYGMHEKKQIPCVMNMLTRDLILPRKGPVNRKSPGNRPKVNLNNIKISKGMPICLLLLYFIVSLSRQRLFMAAGAGPS